ncbi:MAG TPA: excinuclease ABC subunit UvrC [Lacibacter sp.]|nr:excinuclease ABC subunit UvrC [Lacibacter sp.]
MTQETFRKLAPTIPRQPGIYKYYDAGGTLLYVGKAKNIYKRVSSYFIKQHTNRKTSELVRRIEQIEYTIVNSEQDAFLLENSLIKQFRPLFNIDLKDDKTYPYIVVKKEPFPRVFLTRRKINDGSVYLGPFTSVAKVRELMDFVRQQIPLRTCKLNLSAQNIQKKKYKVCLEYHLGNCKGPCEGLQTEANYNQDLEQVRNILSGNLAPVIQYFKAEQKRQIEELAFEKAALTQKKLEHLEAYKARSEVVHSGMGNADVCTVVRYKDQAFLNYMQVEHGAIIRTENIQVACKLDETEPELLEFLLPRLHQRFASRAKEWILPFPPEWMDPGYTVTVPRAGARKKLLDLSQKNTLHAVEAYQQKERLHLVQYEQGAAESILASIREALHLQELPVHIECFDNSNFQGAYPVSAMVCFRNGKPSKKEYRHYNVKTVTGIDDFASMKEVVYRRYKRLLKEGTPLPPLLIIDGGQGQLAAAMESLEALGISKKLTVVGLAKNVEEIFFAGDRESLRLPYESVELKLIRYIRDEVHRFGIAFHRNQRSRGTFRNQLENIPGIGEATIVALLKAYKSVATIREQSADSLARIIGIVKARKIKEALAGPVQEHGLNT